MADNPERGTQEDDNKSLSEPIPFILSDESINKRGGVIKTLGILLEEFLRNPIMLYNHLRRGNYDDNPLPIGKWENVRVVGKKLVADARFHLEDEYAKSIYQKVKAGILNAVSIGIRILKTSTDRKDLVKGQTRATVTASMLFECSVVDIPANGNAMRIDKNIGESGAMASNSLIDVHYYVPDPKNTGSYVELNLNKNPQALEGIIPLIKKSNMATDNNEVITLLGLAEDSTAVQVYAEITKLKNERDQFKQQLEELDAQMKEEQCKALIDTAVNDRRLTEGQRDTWLKLAKSDFEGTKDALEGMIKAPKLSDVVNNGAGDGTDGSKGKSTLGDEALYEKHWAEGTLSDWKASNPDEYERCRAAYED